MNQYDNLRTELLREKLHSLDKTVQTVIGEEVILLKKGRLRFELERSQ